MVQARQKHWAHDCRHVRYFGNNCFLSQIPQLVMVQCGATWQAAETHIGTLTLEGGGEDLPFSKCTLVTCLLTYLFQSANLPIDLQCMQCLAEATENQAI